MTAAPAVRVALGLGSNLGDRRASLQTAVDRIRKTPDVRFVAASPIVESSPVGGPPQPDFLNAVVIVDTTLTPHEILTLAHDCEREADRVREVRWGPRTLDVDVLVYGDLGCDDPELTLPHPLASQRAFVLVPWAAVDPEFRLAGRRVQEWAADVDAAGVRESGLRWDAQ